MTPRHPVSLAFGLATAFAIQFAFAADPPSNTERSVSLQPGTPGCLTSTFDDNGSKKDIKWCILFNLFQPLKHTVQIDEIDVLSGVSANKAEFTRSINDRSFNGSCVEQLKIASLKTMKRALITSLPPDIVSACDIPADSAGNTTTFPRTRHCDAAIHQNIPALAFRFHITSYGQKCIVRAESTEVFSGLFILD